MTLPRVVYLSAPPLGEAVLEWLRTQPCEVYFENVRGDLCWPMGDYDLGLNFLASRRILPEQIRRPRLGWVNFHPAPLPEFGGRNVAYHAIMQGATQYGATVHYMDEDFDTGDIIKCKRFPIKPTDTAGDLMLAAKGLLVSMFQEIVPELLAGIVPATPQQGQTVYYPKRPIDDELPTSWQQRLLIRALTNHPKHHARIDIAGRRFKIVPEDQG